jgi:hypothetical protein
MKNGKVDIQYFLQELAEKGGERVCLLKNFLEFIGNQIFYICSSILKGSIRAKASANYSRKRDRKVQ